MTLFVPLCFRLGQLISLAGIDQSKMPFSRAASSAPCAYIPPSTQPALKTVTSLPAQPPVISIQSPVLPPVDDGDREQRLNGQLDFHSELAHARAAATGTYVPPSIFPQNFQNGRDPTMAMSASSETGRGKTMKFDELYQQCLTETEDVLMQNRPETVMKSPPATTGPEGDAPIPPPTLPKPATGWQLRHDEEHHHSDNQSERSQHQPRSHTSSQHSMRSQHSSQLGTSSQRSGGRSRRSEKTKRVADGEARHSEAVDRSVSEISEQLEIDEKMANSDNDTF